jgi:dihydrofolate synthase/folylpolyglutamate synthase
MRFNTLPEWLSWQENLHFTEVDPGLARIGQVWRKLNGKSLPFRVVTVAGTNGKGSSVAMLESILRSAGYKTGTYTSPHLLRYNERICVNHEPCDDDTICQAFERIDQARDGISLTYFEYATLAAIDIFCEQEIDIAILEVGMGGRLDAVNLFDADIALITPIGIDHTAWLGTTRELIGAEKAGIMRAERPVVCSESVPPQSVLDYAQSLPTQLYHAERDFSYSKCDETWSWSSHSLIHSNLSKPNLEGLYQFDNASAVLKVIELLSGMGLNISSDDINKGLVEVRLSGRFQRIPGQVERILDVTHNQQGAENLVNLLSAHPCEGKTYAVLGMFKDKDVSSVLSVLDKAIDSWFLAGLTGSRALSADEIYLSAQKVIQPEKLEKYDDVVTAYEHAMEHATSGDRVLIFGSFHTVEAVLKHI